MLIRVAAILVVSVALSTVILAYTLSYAPGAEAATCAGKQVYPSQNLAAVAKGSGAGTTFCIHDGLYKVTESIVAQDGDHFIGLYQDDTRPAIETRTAKYVIDIGQEGNVADHVTVKNLSVSGAVHSNHCEPDCGRGIGGPGNYLYVENVRAHHNENQGIGGTGNGLRVIGSELDHNGSHDAADNSSRSAAGIKSINSMYVYNSYIHDNYWIGVWCDLSCGTFEVHDSTITANGKIGIHDEISSGPALFEGNRIQGNGYSESYDGKLQGGIMITSSRHVRTHHNTFVNNAGPGVLVRQSSRGPRLRYVTIYDNVMQSDGIKGCGLAGVNCYRN